MKSTFEELWQKIKEESQDLLPVRIVYHGTRCPQETIESHGLRFDEKFLVGKIKEICEYLTIDFDDWRSKIKKVSFNSRLIRLIQGQLDKGRVIWVTEDFDNAVSYSTRNPEIIYDAILSMVRYKYPRRWWRKSWEEKTELLVKEILSMIGTPKVIEIDALKVGVSRKGHFSRVNIPLGYKCVPTDAIIKIHSVGGDK